MSIVNKPNTFSANTVASPTEVNDNFDTIYNNYNGGITAANLATDAVTTAKIADANVTTAKIADSTVTRKKIDWSTFANNMKTATSTTAGTPVNGSNVNLAGNGATISFTLGSVGYALVTVSVSTFSTTDFENKPLIMVDGSAVLTLGIAAARGDAARTWQRSYTAPVTLSPGTHTISAGIYVASATSPNVPAGNAYVSAVVFGDVTA
jgi:hypothetical protein